MEQNLGRTNQEMGIELIQSGDGGYITVGDTGSYGAGAFDVFLNKYNQNGDLLWSRTWGGTDWDYGYSIAKTNNGDYVVTGSTLSYGAGLDDMFLTKFSSDGALLWSRTWGGAKYDWGSSVIQTNDGGYSIAGTTESYSGESDNATVLVKYSVDGLLLWNKSWNRFYQSWGTSVIQTNSGNYLTVGESYDREKSNYDMYILEYNSNGINIGCSLSECQSPTASVSSPSVTTLSPIATMTSPNVTIASPIATTTDPFPPPPQMTVTFSSQELYIAYPGESQTVCKEWTVPNGKYIKGFQVSQETESEYDYFTVSLDEVEIYNKSGMLANEYINTSNTPGTTLKACMSADSSYQEGYGGEVAGVVYD